MTAKLLLTLVAAIGIAPAVLWALLSLVVEVISVLFRPVSLSFRFYSSTGGRYHLEYYDLPVSTSICILAGAALFFIGIASAKDRTE